MSLESKIETIKDRAEQLYKAREFFRKKRVLEVDVAYLSSTSSVDTHIDPIEAIAMGQKAYLHTSPEYRMKRLLAAGSGDIYQLGHVFRDGEVGARHNVEFMMAEWYRVGVDFISFIEETVEFISLFVDVKGFELLSYKEAFLRYTGIDPFAASNEELRKRSQAHAETRDDHLNYIIATEIEPHLGKKGICTVLTYYPPSQAALAKVRTVDAIAVAERFEIYIDGIELANGYNELQDPVEQEKRLLEENKERLLRQKNELIIDSRFLEALHCGMPECCGVAVGFDRLMLLRHKAKSIEEVIPFSWDQT